MRLIGPGTSSEPRAFRLVRRRCQKVFVRADLTDQDRHLTKADQSSRSALLEQYCFLALARE